MERPTEPIWALFSGGKDSFAVAKWLQEHDRLKAVVLLDTGINVPEWESITRSIAERAGFPVEVYPTEYRYEWFIWKYGFPGAQGHRYAMNYLKGRAIRSFKKRHPFAWLASGVREDESSRRALTTKEFGVFEGVPIWAPIYNWTTEHVWHYVRSHGYERPQSYITLGVSGDCLCGAYAMSHEREALATHYPTIDARLRQIEQSVKEKFPSRCRWGKTNEAKCTTSEESIICVECKREET